MDFRDYSNVLSRVGAFLVDESDNHCITTITAAANPECVHVTLNDGREVLIAKSDILTEIVDRRGSVSDAVRDGVDSVVSAVQDAYHNIARRLRE